MPTSSAHSAAVRSSGPSRRPGLSRRSRGSTLGLPQLIDRLDLVVVAVGIFALGEALWVAAHLRRIPLQIVPVGRSGLSRSLQHPY